MDRQELLALGVSTDLQTAARALGIGRNTAYTLAQRGEFPTKVLRLGTRFVVPTAGLRALLDVVEPERPSKAS